VEGLVWVENEKLEVEMQKSDSKEWNLYPVTSKLLRHQMNRCVKSPGSVENWIGMVVGGNGVTVGGRVGGSRW